MFCSQTKLDSKEGLSEARDDTNENSIDNDDLADEPEADAEKVTISNKVLSKIFDLLIFKLSSISNLIYSFSH